MEALLTIIGAAASIGGACVAFWQAKKSKNAAQAAREARDKLVERRETTEIATLEFSCRRAVQSMEKYGAGHARRTLAGVNTETDGQVVQEFLQLLQQHGIYFGVTDNNQADQFSQTLDPILLGFTESRNLDEKKQQGKLILNHLNSMLSILKSRLDERRERLR